MKKNIYHKTVFLNKLYLNFVINECIRVQLLFFTNVVSELKIVQIIITSNRKKTIRLWITLNSIRLVKNKNYCSKQSITDFISIILLSGKYTMNSCESYILLNWYECQVLYYVNYVILTK